MRAEWSSRIPRQKCVQPRNIEAKARTKHCSFSQRAQKSSRLTMRTVYSANQLGVYGAVSSWCFDFVEACKVRDLLE